MTTYIAITTGTIGVAIGMVGLLPGVMAFDAVDATTTSMKLLGVSTLSIIPVSIVATTMTILTQDLKYQCLYGFPILGIGSAFVLESQKVQEVSSGGTAPPFLEVPSVPP